MARKIADRSDLRIYDKSCTYARVLVSDAVDKPLIMRALRTKNEQTPPAPRQSEHGVPPDRRLA